MGSKFIFFCAVLAAAQAAAASALPDGDVFDDVRRSCVCVVGAIIGAFLAISVFPPDDDSETNKTRRLALKFGASMCGGIVFTPAAMQWIGLPKTSDYLMGGSAIVAVFVVSGLHFIAPKVESVIRKLAK